jgi:hypothetical protein
LQHIGEKSSFGCFFFGRRSPSGIARRGASNGDLQKSAREANSHAPLHGMA